MAAQVEDKYSFFERARRFICYEAWNIGVVDQSAADIVERGIVTPVRWLPRLPAGIALADPAYRRRADGSQTLYAEHINYNAPVGAPVGAIWSAELGAGVDPANACFQPLLTHGFHMSYPFPFEDEQGRSFLTAESWQAGGALLWREHQGLQFLGKLMDDRPMLDPTLWRGPDRW